MADPVDHSAPIADAADPQWFREPTRRERWIAAALFIGFGIFFALLWHVQAGWSFRWVILVLGFISVLYGLRHARSGLVQKDESNVE